MHSVISTNLWTCTARQSTQNRLKTGLDGGGFISHTRVEPAKQRNQGSARMAVSPDLHRFAQICLEARILAWMCTENVQMHIEFMENVFFLSRELRCSIHAYSHSNAYIYTRLYIYIHTCIYIYTYTCIDVYTYIYIIYVHAYMITIFEGAISKSLKSPSRGPVWATCLQWP